MDPWTLAYLAGYRDRNITKCYVHPQEQTIHAAMSEPALPSVGILLVIPSRSKMMKLQPSELRG
jgi:hypothetical protein